MEAATTTTTTTAEGGEEQSSSLENALDALRLAKEEVEDELLPKRLKTSSSPFDLLEKVLSKFSDNNNNKGGNQLTAKDVAAEFARKWMREYNAAQKEYEKEGQR